MELKTLLGKALEKKQQVTDLKGEIAELDRTKSEMEAAGPDYSSLDIENEAQMLQMATRGVRLQALPVKIEQLDANLGVVLEELEAIIGKLKASIITQAQVEQKKLATEIEDKLKPYSELIPVNVSGKTEMINPAATAAWQMPMVLSIGNAVEFATRPVRGAFPRSQDAKRFDEQTLEHVDEIVAVAQRYLDSGTFVAARFKR